MNSFILPGALSRLIGVSPRILCHLTDISIEDTENHVGPRRRYTPTEAALVVIALFLQQGLGWTSHKIRAATRDLIDGKQLVVTLSWPGNLSHPLKINLREALGRITRRIHELLHP